MYSRDITIEANLRRYLVYYMDDELRLSQPTVWLWKNGTTTTVKLKSAPFILHAANRDIGKLNVDMAISAVETGEDRSIYDLPNNSSQEDVFGLVELSPLTYTKKARTLPHYTTITHNGNHCGIAIMDYETDRTVKPRNNRRVIWMP